MKKHEQEEADKQTLGGAPEEKKSEKPSSQDQNSHPTKNKPEPSNQGDSPVVASNAEAPHNPSKVEGLGGGKSDEVDLTAGKARLTTDPKGPQATEGEVQRAAEI